MDMSGNAASARFLPSAGPVILVGFAGGLALWVTWFITHLPWLGLSEPVSLPMVIAAWALALGFTVWRLGPEGLVRGAVLGAAGGGVGAASGLMMLGTKITKITAHSGETGDVSVVPAAPLVVVGFLAFGIVLGGMVGGLAALVRRPRATALARRNYLGRPNYLGRFGLLTAATIAPMLFIGGLVTSTNSGMAVPDWPNTFGSNMFLYPLGPRVAVTMGKTYEDVFFEHAHRLFGTFIGLTVLVLMIWTLRTDARRWVRRLAIAAFALVALQGLLGGIRVNEGHIQAELDKVGRYYSMAHGILAQLVFGVVIVLAVVLGSLFRAAPEIVRAGDAPADAATAKRLKTFATALLHSLILQLLLGAAYRHLRHDHVLWAHIGFSIIVTVAALTAGFMLTTLAGTIGRRVATLGWALVVGVVLQFLMGWVTFLFGSGQRDATTASEAIIRTLHQANGAMVLALATAAYVWALRVKHLAAPASSSGPAPANTPATA